jgi:hypothetical protein
MWLNMQFPMKFTPCSALRLGAGGRAASLVCTSMPVETAVASATSVSVIRTRLRLERNLWGFLKET